MSVNAIGTTTAVYTQPTTDTAKKTSSENTAAETAAESTAADTGVIYEKSSETTDTVTATKTNTKSNPAIIAQLKADAEARTAQLQSLVEKMITKQGQTLAKTDDMWAFLASGNFTADAETIAQAQRDVAEDGYWGAEQTSDRILSFAKALAGDDPDKADELLEAFKKGYKEATGTWGKELPTLCSDTYDLVEKKFNEWKNGTAETEDSKNTADTTAEKTEA